jgi:hypothetical protein
MIPPVGRTDVVLVRNHLLEVLMHLTVDVAPVRPAERVVVNTRDTGYIGVETPGLPCPLTSWLLLSSVAAAGEDCTFRGYDPHGDRDKVIVLQLLRFCAGHNAGATGDSPVLL